MLAASAGKTEIENPIHTIVTLNNNLNIKMMFPSCGCFFIAVEVPAPVLEGQA